MATRNRLSMAGNGGSALLETLDAFKRKHVSQNKDIIRRNMELMKLNTDLNKRLRELQHENMELQGEALKANGKAAQLETAIATTKDLLEMERLRNQTLESRSNGLGCHAEELRNALTIIAAQAHQASLLLSQPCLPPMAEIKPTDLVEGKENVLDQASSKEQTRRVSIDQGVLPQRLPLVTEPDLSFISEGSLEFDDARRNSPRNIHLDAWRNTTKIMRNPLAYSTSPAASPPSSPENATITVKTVGEKTTAKRRQSMILPAPPSFPISSRPLVVFDSPISSQPRTEGSAQSDDSPLRLLSNEKTPAQDWADQTPNNGLSESLRTLEIAPQLQVQRTTPETSGDTQPTVPTSRTVAETESVPARVRKRRKSAVQTVAKDSVPNGTPAPEDLKSTVNESLEQVESRAMRRISELIQARKDAALVLGRVEVEEPAPVGETSAIQTSDALASTVSRRRRPLVALPQVSEESKSGTFVFSNRAEMLAKPTLAEKPTRRSTASTSRSTSPTISVAAADRGDDTDIVEVEKDREEEEAALSTAVGRRSKKAVNYALPSLRAKMRQPEGYVPSIKKPSARHSHSVINSAYPSGFDGNTTPNRPGAELDENGRVLSSLPRRKSSTLLDTLGSPLGALARDDDNGQD